jgi:hypothetical protein
MSLKALQVEQLAAKVEGDIDGVDFAPSLGAAVRINGSSQQV